MQKVKDYLEKVNRARGGWYWLGTYGGKGTGTLWSQKSKQSGLKDWYARHADAKAKGMGKQVFDCIGIDKYARWVQSDGSVPYDASTDLNEAMLFAKAKQDGMKNGKIATIPNVAGIMVWHTGHIGVYLGNGTVLEARGGDYGVVETSLPQRNFTDWFYNPFIDYAEETNNMKSGDKNDTIKLWQAFLNTNGFSLVVDGSFGPATAASTDIYKKSIGLNQDGTVDFETLFFVIGKITASLASAKTTLTKSEATVKSRNETIETLNSVITKNKATMSDQTANIERIESNHSAQLKAREDEIAMHEADIKELTEYAEVLEKKLADTVDGITPVSCLTDATLGELLGAIWSKIKGI